MNQESKASMKFYYKDGTSSDEYHYSKQLHRIDGPAAEYGSGTKLWYVDGKRHRLDGPAEEWASGGRYWWIDEVEYSEGEFNKFIQEVKELPLALRLIDPREWVRNYE